MSLPLLLLFWARVAHAVPAGDCVWEYIQGGQDNANSIFMRFACGTDWDGYAVDINLSSDTSGFDPVYTIAADHVVTADQWVTVTTAIPAEWRADCNPDQVYFQISYSSWTGTDYFESNRFLPSNMVTADEWTCRADECWFDEVSSQFDDANNLLIIFTCGDDWASSSIGLYLREDLTFDDSSFLVQTVTQPVPGVWYTVSYSVPSELRLNCEPDNLYFSLYYSVNSYFETTRFLPSNMVTASNCETPSSTCTWAEVPNGQEDANSVSMKFICGDDWAGLSVNIDLQQDIFGIDNKVTVLADHVVTANTWKTVSIAVPSEWRGSCSPGSLYFQVDYNVYYFYESDRFLPFNMRTATDCSDILTPIQDAQIPMTSSTITWQLADDAAWVDWNLEFYLYRDVQYWVDPWWFIAGTSALDFSLPLHPTALGVNADTDEQWYIAAYWRDNWLGLFTFWEMESGRFHLVDESDVCTLSFPSTGVDLQCCGAVHANSFCRVNAGPLQLEVQNIALTLGIEDRDTPCSVGVFFDVLAIARLQYVDDPGQASPVKFAEYEFPLDIDYAWDLTEGIEHEQQLIDMVDVSMPPPASTVLNANLLAVFNFSCDNQDGITFRLKTRGAGEVEIPYVKTFEVAETESTVFKYTWAWDELLPDTSSEQCFDMLDNSGNPWVDTSGARCEDYTQSGWCGTFGNCCAVNGLTANDACCVCGGGSASSIMVTDTDAAELNLASTKVIDMTVVTVCLLLSPFFV